MSVLRNPELREYWIEEIRNTKEFSLLADLEEEELNRLSDTIEGLLDDQFISTARERGISRREKMLGITPYADDSLETRRFRVYGNWNSSLPYSYKVLLERLDSICGEGGYTAELNCGEYSLLVKVELVVKRMEEDVRNILHTMCPANLLITVELRYRQHKELNPKTHSELRVHNHEYLKEGEEL